MQAATLDVIAGLAPEEEQPEQKRLEVVRSPELDALMQAFSLFLRCPRGQKLNIVTQVTPWNQTAYTITQASVLLSGVSEHPDFRGSAGLFLTDLVNKSGDESHTIYVSSYAVSPDCIGYKLAPHKRLTVHGDTRYNTGDFNLGTLLLHGNSYMVGFWNQGIIVLHGSTQKWAGSENEGSITIKGHAGSYIGGSNRGIIMLDGSFDSLGLGTGTLGSGDIYHNGVLIVEKGRRLV